jgi:hypothetical protein
MGIERSHRWSDLAASNEHLAVFLALAEVLEGLLGDSASSMRQIYYMSADGGQVDRASRAQVSDVWTHSADHRIRCLSGSPHRH